MTTLRDAKLCSVEEAIGLIQDGQTVASGGFVGAGVPEGLARALPQALIAGKPVVSYDVDGAREVVIPDQTGYLLPPKTVAEMADALIRLVADPTLRARLGAEGRRRFTDTFRHERMTAQIRSLYERLLAG